MSILLILRSDIGLFHSDLAGRQRFYIIPMIFYNGLPFRVLYTRREVFEPGKRQTSSLTSLAVESFKFKKVTGQNPVILQRSRKIMEMTGQVARKRSLYPGRNKLHGRTELKSSEIGLTIGSRKSVKPDPSMKHR